MEELKSYFLSPKPWVSIAIIAVCCIIWLQLRKFVKKRFIKKETHDRKEGAIQLGLNAVKYIIALFAILSVLQINGINVSSVTAGLGIASIVVGFALQDALRDWIMGVGIVWEHYFSVGDVVRYKEYEGQIIKFNFKTTKIIDIKTGNTVVISNRNISEIERLSDWCDINVPAPYEVPAARMRQICEKLTKLFTKIPDVRSCEFLGTEKFADSQILYCIRIHCAEDKKPSVRRAALGIIQDIYAEEQIAIPYTQMDIHISQQTTKSC